MSVLKLFELEVHNNFLDLYFLIKGSKILIPKQPTLVSLSFANVIEPRCAVQDVLFLFLFLSENILSDHRLHQLRSYADHKMAAKEVMPWPGVG